jgi:hypothetical protein
VLTSPSDEVFADQPFGRITDRDRLSFRGPFSTCHSMDCEHFEVGKIESTETETYLQKKLIKMNVSASAFMTSLDSQLQGCAEDIFTRLLITEMPKYVFLSECLLSTLAMSTPD